MANHVKPENLQGDLRHLSNTSKVSKVWHKRCYPCTLKTNALRVCAMAVRDTQGSVWSQKHGMCKWKMHFLYVKTWGKKQHLPRYAASALFVQDKLWKNERLPAATTAEKHVRRHVVYVNQSRKNIKKVYSTTNRRFATVQHPFRGLEPQTPRPKHQALAPSLPMLLSDKLMFVNVLLTFNASARTCGQKLWQTMSKLENLQGDLRH